MRNGGGAIAYHEAGADVIALDIDPVYLELTAVRAKAENLPLTLVRGSGFELPFQNASFDIVVLADVYEHVQYPKRVFQECFRILKEDGVLYVSAPNRLSVRCIRHEPHYGLPWIVLMPRWMAEWWVTKIKRSSSTYELFAVPSYFSLMSALKVTGFTVDESWGFEVITPGLISGCITKRIYWIFKRLGLHRLIVNKYHARLRLMFSLENLHFIGRR
jgi:SAM-dependent methyltransferase